MSRRVNAGMGSLVVLHLACSRRGKEDIYQASHHHSVTRLWGTPADSQTTSAGHRKAEGVWIRE